jgi:hypothetical protein
MEEPVYHLINIRSSASGGFEGLIGGPGISGPGVRYWCDSEDELKTLVENLNLSYSTGKEVAHWRRASFPTGVSPNYPGRPGRVQPISAKRRNCFSPAN